MDNTANKRNDDRAESMIPKRYWLVFSTFLLSMLLYVDRVCISVAGESVKTDLRLTTTQFGWVLSAFALGYALCQTPSGMLADRFGPRRILTAVVTFWSIFTALTAMAWNLTSLLLFRVLFGAGEAGAFPGCARAFYSWLPMTERGLAQGINFSGSRLGAAFALPVVAAMIASFGWRQSFFVLAAVGVAWAVFWYRWFRDSPEQDPSLSESEKSLILDTRQQAVNAGADAPNLTAGALFGSRNMWLVSFQYFCSNYTFFFCLSWMFPYLEETYNLGGIKTGLYGSIPLLCGAVGSWISGAMVDWIYRLGHWNLSRRLPAILGFILVVIGLVGIVGATGINTAIVWLSIAILGADMTLSPSWSLCIDIGRRNAGAVSGTMNMAGNFGAFITPLAFAYLTVWTGTTVFFFYLGAGLSVLAVLSWLLIQPQRPLEDW